MGIPDGPEAVTGDDGRWTLAGLPTGTRLLEVRAVGYYPRRIPIDVVEHAAEVDVALQTFQAVLDTVRVTASRFRTADNGFDERRRSGMGRYLTDADLRARNAIQVSDVFRMMPGMQVERVGVFGDPVITMRSAFGRCVPALYVDGHYLPIAGGELDGFVHPDEIAAIEVYTSAVPPQFQQGMTGCGSVVLWTKPYRNPASRWSIRRRALHGVGAIVLGVATGIVLSNRQ